MVKKTSKGKTKPVNRGLELAKLDQLITRIDGYSVPELQLEKSLEECRQLNDQFSLVHVEALDIEAPQDYSEYGSYLRRIKVVQKRLEEQRKQEKQPHLEEGRIVDAKFGGFAGFASRLFVLFDEAMTVWDKKQAELTRKKEVALREKQRKEQERLDKAAAKKAAKLEAEGRHDEADAVVEAVPILSTPVVEQTNVPKVAGVSKPTKHYRTEMSEGDIKVQEKLLRQAIEAWNANHLAPNLRNQIIPAEYWALDEKKLDAMARTLKGKLELPNVKVVDTPRRAVRV